MNTPSTHQGKVVFLAALLLCIPPAVLAQTGSTPSQSNPSSPGANGSIVQGKDTSPLNSAATMNMAATRETNAFQVFQSIPDSQFDKKIKSGDEFIKKFATSSYLPSVYSILAVTYIENGQPQKGFAAGEKALALRPDDVRTLANLGQAMARLYKPTDPDAAQRLQKAEEYAKKCIQITPTLLKPGNITDAQFTEQTNKNLAMAHGALGLIRIHQGKFSDAIPELQQAIKFDDGKDATNLYLLGVASQNSSHYAEALDAFNKCAAAAPANLQKACQDGVSAAQKNLASKSKSAAN
jgi:tetratricopeptide (TPR) repeat protein